MWCLYVCNILLCIVNACMKLCMYTIYTNDVCKYIYTCVH